MLAGIRKLKKVAIPSIFQWKQESPKRKPPKERELASPKRRSITKLTTQDEKEPTCKNLENLGCQTDITQCELIKQYENALYYTDERPILEMLENIRTFQ